MAIDYKEYTKYRDIAQKRIKRAIAAGVPLYIHVPTVKELRQVGEAAQEIELTRLQQFLETGFSLSKRKEKERAKINDEERKARRRAKEREYRRMKVARELEREDYPYKYQSYVKGIATLGVNIPPSKLPAFFAYMDYRFSQGKGSKKYVFDIFVDDFQTMLKKGYSANQILTDFKSFEADQAMIAERAGGMLGTSYEKAISLWDRFIESKKGKKES